jgi:hypothetical protein
MLSLRRRALRIAAFTLSLTAFASARAFAQAAGEVAGKVVTAADLPVVGAFVSVDDAEPITQTDADGSFRISGLSAGRHGIIVRRSGYVPSIDSVDVSALITSQLNIVLTEKVATLAGVTVIGTRTDLAERRQQLARVPGGVAMVEAPQIRATRQANLKDVLQFVPGVYIQPRFGAADESQISIRGSGLRDNFQARGVNLLVNGMPYRNADGFTDFESLDMLTA